MPSHCQEPLFRRASAKGWQARRPPQTGEPLSVGDEERFGAGFGVDLSHVRVHRDGAAARTAETLGAAALTVGSDIYFAKGAYRPGTPGGDHLLAHELAHSVQQGSRPSFSRSSTLPPSSGAQEREADAAARAVLQGGFAPIERAGSGPALALQAADPGHDAATRAIAALNRASPVAGVGDPFEALSILRPLAADALLTAVIEIDDQFLLDVLIANLAPDDTTPLAATIFAVRATSPTATRDDQFAARAARGLALLPVTDQDRMLSRVLARRGTPVDITQVREGLAALQESETDLSARGTEEVDSLATAPSPLAAGILPGPWNPGNQPVPFYIGTMAHLAITENYRLAHLGELTFYNYTPISSILAAAAAAIPGLQASPGLLSAMQAALRPDIANVTRRHIYEIKPANAALQAASELALYLAAFQRAGLVMLPGPTGEPGTSGAVAAPGGAYIFSAPAPGVITYVYRQPQRRRERVRESVPETAPAVDRSLVERISIATGLTGAALYIYIIISEGSRVAFPPRNAIPLP